MQKPVFFTTEGGVPSAGPPTVVELSNVWLGALKTYSARPCVDECGFDMSCSELPYVQCVSIEIVGSSTPHAQEREACYSTDMARCKLDTTDLCAFPVCRQIMTTSLAQTLVVEYALTPSR